ncbi:MAG TPA: hypothetical protein VLE19_08135 [Pyrinomonadaceae bacterium]|nr:hypothetical protein [Pyrinomonadaceae bacterium]
MTFEVKASGTNAGAMLDLFANLKANVNTTGRGRDGKLDVANFDG